jgi:hypothetical protein
VGNPLSTTSSRQSRGDVPELGSARVRPWARWSPWWALWLTVGYLAQVAIRVWLAHWSLVPQANPDESAYLITARVLAHAGAASDFSYGTLYQGGYPLLLVPIYWFTSNSVTVYHAVTVENSILNAFLMPLAYLVLRRLALPRWTAYVVAAATALVPEGLFYTQFALADAIFPVLTLAWLLCVHTWLNTRTALWSCVAATGSALLAGYSYAVHPRGLVTVVAFVLVAVWVFLSRMTFRWSVVPAALATAVLVEAERVLSGHIRVLLYPEGPRSLRSTAVTHLTDLHAQVRIVEMTMGEIWRLTLDTWGLATMGVIAAVIVVFRRRVRADLRIMAAVAVIMLAATVYIAPAALPDNQGTNWASGRYPDSFEVFFFIVGVIVLLRARGWRLIGYGAGAAVVAIVTGLTVQHYDAVSQPVSGFGAFNWAEPTVLAQGWAWLSIRKATAVAVGLMVLWVVLALVVRRLSGTSWARWRVALVIPIAAMNVFAIVQMATKISGGDPAGQNENSLQLVTGGYLKPGDRVEVDYQVPWRSWVPQSFEVWWAPLTFFDASKDAPSPGTTLVEVPWPGRGSARDSWPQAPKGWYVVTSNPAYDWVAWHAPTKVGR